MGTAPIIVTLISIFILVGIFLPYAESAFSNTQTINQVDNLEATMSTAVDETNVVTLGKVLVSVGKMFFWTFGDLPFWLDSFFLLLRITLIILIIMTFVGIGS